MSLVFLDGPLGSELEARGVALPAPAWTARALAEAPQIVAAIHRDYAEAGADVHTTATFRTRRRSLAQTPWAGRHDELARLATELCRAAVEAVGHGRVAGGLAPLEDCFRPDLTPGDAALAAEHAELAEVLADAGCDLLLVETMPTLRELIAATRAAVATGLPVWSAVTFGPDGNAFDEDSLLRARDAAFAVGAEAFLINCTPADRITAALEHLASHPPTPASTPASNPSPTPGPSPVFDPPTDPPALTFGAYGNALFEGQTDWPAGRYVDEAERWPALGATILGGCCGTTPAHLALLRKRLLG